MRRLAAVLAIVLGIVAGTANAQPLPVPGTALQGAPAGGVFHPGYVANNWYLPYLVPSLAGSGWANPTVGRVVCSYGAIAQTMTINSLGALVTTLGAGNVQWAIYNNGSWGRPSTLVVASASVSTGAAGIVTAAVTQQLAPGNYWWCQNMDNATAIMASYSAGTGLVQGFVGGNAANIVIATAGASMGIYTAQTYGTWPAFNSSTAWTNPTTDIVPTIEFKVASVP